MINYSQLSSAALCLTLLLISHTAYSIVLSNFNQSLGRLELFFDQKPIHARFIRLSKVPLNPDLTVLKKQAHKMFIYENKLNVKIDLATESSQHEYSIFIFVNDNYLELIRQSSTWLAKTFNYNKPGGYTILGRRSVDINSDKQFHSGLASLEFHDSPHLAMIKPLGSSEYPAVRLANGLLHYL